MDPAEGNHDLDSALPIASSRLRDPARVSTGSAKDQRLRLLVRGAVQVL